MSGEKIDKWYCPNCGIVDAKKRADGWRDYECDECEADITPLHPSITALQQRLSALEAAQQGGQGDE